MQQTDNLIKVQAACLLVIAAIAVAVALYLLRPVMIPFIIAAFIAFSLLPFIDLIVRRLKAPHPLAVTVVLLLSFGFLFIVSALLVTSTRQFAANADAYQQVIKSNVIQVIDSVESYFMPENGDSGPHETAGSETIDGAPGSSTVGKEDMSLADTVRDEINALIQQGVVKTFVLNISKVLADLLKQGLLIFIFVLFLLLGSKPRKTPPGGVWKEVEKKIRAFLVKKVILSAITGILVGLILQVIGIEFAMFFGFLTFALNFIPSIGSVIATLIPLPMVFLHENFSIGLIIMVLLIPGVIQFTIGNIIEPKIMGDGLDLHPVVLLMALIFWGMIWGVVGMLLATPMTAMLKILLQRNDMTAPVADIMAGRLDRLHSDS
ncbi:AI-2E family transporter [Desulfatiferula olefinivorans]